jgi:hypothetical protein
MKNPKPSELPVDTVIGTIPPHYSELFIKTADGIWEDLFSGCGCCEPPVRVSDAGWGEDKEPSTYSISCPVTRNETSDEFFGTDYKLIALPVSVPLFLAGVLAFGSDKGETEESEMLDAIKAVALEEKTSAQEA